MPKVMTIQDAVEELDLYDVYNDIIESYADELEDPSLVSDLYDLIDEYDEEFEFWADSDGDYTDSFEKNLKEAIETIVEEEDSLSFIDDDYTDIDDIPKILEETVEEDSDEYDVDLDDEDTDDDDDQEDED
ncbi:MAG: hypothetical protein ABIJ31_14790 [Pseudomonadota bacterium]